MMMVNVFEINEILFKIILNCKITRSLFLVNKKINCILRSEYFYIKKYEIDVPKSLSYSEEEKKHILFFTRFDINFKFYVYMKNLLDRKLGISFIVLEKSELYITVPSFIIRKILKREELLEPKYVFIRFYNKEFLIRKYITLREVISFDFNRTKISYFKEIDNNIRVFTIYKNLKPIYSRINFNKLYFNKLFSELNKNYNSNYITLQ